LSTAKNYPLTF
nr:immunoglobulin light chain junction region [Macaca mulatta]